MKRFKLVLSAAVLVAACSSTAMAGTPKVETKDAKSEAPVETSVKAKQSHTYWIQSRDGSDYVLTNTPSPQCGQATVDPCKITTDDDFSGTMRIDQDKVDSENGVTIDELRPAL
ncbi:hypothetical protein [Pedobacter jeongneungensis]|uniref:hypothetical protein n=1 Tax=Pedobacter jeongneungensis TaxID=947309 RepID=UPI00046AB25C|nr:hypothetical protein [Pedobacter jeongneungensis]